MTDTPSDPRAVDRAHRPDAQRGTAAPTPAAALQVKDLNRDHSLLGTGDEGLCGDARDYTPDVAVDGTTRRRGPPRSAGRRLNVFEALSSEAKNGLVEGWIYDNAALAGWYAGPYSNGGASRRRSPKHVRTQEHRGHPVRKSAQRGCHPAGRHRRGERETQVVRPALADQAAARLPLREPRRDPAPGRGVARVPESQRRPDRVPRVPVARVPATAERARRGRSEPNSILDDPPCGYFLTAEQYTGTQPDGTVELRLRLHGITVDAAPGYLVRALGQATSSG